MRHNILLLFCASSLLVSCNAIEPKNDPVTYGEGYISVLLQTDKSCYAPGEAVALSLNNMPGEGVTVRYSHLGTTLSEHPLSSLSWTWQPPATDYQGYLVDLYGTVDGRDTVFASIGVDVSSTPERFPRNGFLSAYGKMTEKEIGTVISDLNRYHINYLQFQDWHWKHHHPLAGTAALPMAEWTDIISRTCYRSTVAGYIDAAHQRGMKCLFYNLAYGALSDAQDDGVSMEWYAYKDTKHQEPDYHPLSSPFKSNIYLTNPGNSDWQKYIAARNDEVYQVFAFDGWQIDQLGYRGALYDYQGQSFDMAATFCPFIESMKKKQPEKSLVMNAVGQYGQENCIAKAPVDFLYTEVWNYSSYGVLSDIITANDSWSSGKKTVLAAYMNYAHGQKGRGYFNTPGVIMTTAAASAWGGTILQMGEHMLCNEYFPDENLAMHGELKRAMISYYDFAVAYENLLRDGGEWYGVDVTCMDGKAVFNQWEPQLGQIATVGKHLTGLGSEPDRDVIHLLSYRNATHLSWCDTDADQGEPDRVEDMRISFATSKTPTAVYVASPDSDCGVMREVDYSYTAGSVTLTLPSIKYWTMVVVEY